VHFSALSGTPRRRARTQGASPRVPAAFAAALPRAAIAIPLAVALPLAVAVPLVAASTPASGSTVSVAVVIKGAKAAIAKEVSAHLEFNAASKTSTAKEKIVADVGTSTGTETVTDGAAVLHVVVTPKAGYISGSSSGLTSLFGMTSAEATKVGKRWEYWKSGTTQFKNLKAVVTVHSLESLLPKSAGTTVSTKGSNNVLKWTSAASGSTPKLNNTLSIANGTNLPVEESSTDAAGEKVTTTITKWGESVTVHTPAAGSSVAASKITG
jgi:hypothetical protein